MKQEEEVSIIKAGTIFIITEGEYSDYRIACMARALVDIDPKQVTKDFPRNNPPPHSGYFGIDKFANWLENELKVIEILTLRELWFGQNTMFVGKNEEGHSQYEWAEPIVSYDEDPWEFKEE